MCMNVDEILCYFFGFRTGTSVSHVNECFPLQAL